jgi:hypothetical protein
MPKNTVKIPAYRLHKGSGQAIVQINGNRHYLGKYKSEKSEERYRRLAVVLGDVSGGLVCRDYDDSAAFGRWSAAHPNYATALPTVATARGGHVYFRAAPTDLRFVDLADGEYRGDSGHYCLLPRPMRIGRATLWRTEELRAWVDAGCPRREQWEIILRAR